MIKLKDLYPNQPSFIGVEEPVNEESLNEAPDHDLFKKLNKVDDQIIKLLMNYTAKANVPAVARSWMMGLHAKLKKVGIKI